MTDMNSPDSCTILLVEPNQENHKVVKTCLEQDHYRVLFAASYDDALQILQCEPINLVLLDDALCGNRAFELCRNIRQTAHTKELPIVMLLDPSIDDIQETGFEAGIDDYISKPVMRNELRARVRTITRLNHYRFLHESHQLMEEQSRQLSKLRSFDRTTGLANFSTFKESLEEELIRAERAGYAIAVMAICANEYDQVLGVYGQLEADKLARQIADRLSAVTHGRGLIGRIDGRCFIVHRPIPRDEDLVHAVQQYRKRFNDAFTVDADEIAITSSIGASTSPSDANDAEKLVSLAVSAMARASNLGRNRYHVYAPSARADVKRQMRIESQIYKALDRQNIELHYQPQIQMSNGGVKCVEALMRMRDENGSLIPPNVFLPIAEECGLMNKLGIWAINQACSHAAILGAKGHTDVRVSVNLSGAELRHPKFLQNFEDALKKSNLSGRLLGLEINEQALTPQPGFDIQTITNILNTIRSHGTSISVDDFGTGYSSLRYLRHFPLDAIKIDQSFVRDVPDDPKATAVVRSIISMGHNLGLRVTAEGVETDSQLRFLRSVDCDDVQGFLYSKAVRFDRLSDTLNKLEHDWSEPAPQQQSPHLMSTPTDSTESEKI